MRLANTMKLGHKLCHVSSKSLFHKSSPKYLSTWCYESSSYCDSDSEIPNVEKSMRYGCKATLTQSNNIQSIYELIQDVHLTDDVKLEEFYMGHRLKLMNGPEKLTNLSLATKSWINELNIIKNSIQPQSLSYITLPYEVVKNADMYTKDLNEFFNELTNIHGNDVKIGIDLSTTLITKSNEDDIEQMMEIINKYKHNTDKKSNQDSLNSSLTLSIVAVALNAYTYKHAIKILSLAKSLGLQTIATEVLRVHMMRPGTWNPPTRFAEVKEVHLEQKKLIGITSRMMPTFDPTAIDTSNDIYVDDGESNQGAGNKENPVEYYNRCSMACMNVETEYLKKFSDIENVNPAHVAWAHFLRTTFPSEQHSTSAISPSTDNSIRNNKYRQIIYFLEEWDYLYNFQIFPLFNEANKQLKRASKETSDWSLLYRPLARSLFKSYEGILVERKAMMNEDARNVLQNHLDKINKLLLTTTATTTTTTTTTPNSTTENNSNDSHVSTMSKQVFTMKCNSHDVPHYLGLLAASASPDIVCLSETPVMPDEWKPTDEIYELHSNWIDAEKTWEILHQVSKSYSD